MGTFHSSLYYQVFYANNEPLWKFCRKWPIVRKWKENRRELTSHLSTRFDIFSQITVTKVISPLFLDHNSGTFDILPTLILFTSCLVIFTPVFHFTSLRLLFKAPIFTSVGLFDNCYVNREPFHPDIC